MATGQPDVFVIRHGATEWSVSGEHTGGTDIPLTEDGVAQATRVGAVLDGRPFALVLVSPMQRAQETCRIAGYLDQAETTDDLREWDYGDYEGISTIQIRRTDPTWTVWDGDTPGGETIEQVQARADRVVDRALAADGDVALFAHGHILRVVTARWCELDAREGKRFPLETATLCRLGWEHEYRTVHLWNARS